MMTRKDNDSDVDDEVLDEVLIRDGEVRDAGRSKIRATPDSFSVLCPLPHTISVAIIDASLAKNETGESGKADW